MAREARKGQSLMDKPEPLTMLGIQDIWRKRKHREKKKNKVHRNNENWKYGHHWPHQETVGKPRWAWRVSSSCF